MNISCLIDHNYVRSLSERDTIKYVPVKLSFRRCRCVNVCYVSFISHFILGCHWCIYCETIMLCWNCMPDFLLYWIYHTFYETCLSCCIRQIDVIVSCCVSRLVWTTLTSHFPVIICAVYMLIYISNISSVSVSTHKLFVYSLTKPWVLRICFHQYI